MENNKIKKHDDIDLNYFFLEKKIDFDSFFLEIDKRKSDYHEYMESIKKTIKLMISNDTCKNISSGTISIDNWKNIMLVLMIKIKEVNNCLNYGYENTNYFFDFKNKNSLEYINHVGNEIKKRGDETLEIIEIEPSFDQEIMDFINWLKERKSEK
jgi:predicted aspartyl protease